VRAHRPAQEDGDVPRAENLLAVGRAQRGRADQYQQPLLLADVPVVGRDALAGQELVGGPAPQRRPEVVAEPALALRVAGARVDGRKLVEEIQKPTPPGAGSGLVTRPGRAPPSLYSDGATSFGPSA
jgi:hypothetical protein